MTFYFTTLILLLNFVGAFCQINPKIFQKDIVADDYRIFLTNSEDHFFTGSIQVADKFNNTVFYEDSIYTSYNTDTLIDLNGDGRKELVLDLSAGATMYYYNMFIIFDFAKNPMIPFQIQNAELMTESGEVTRVLSSVRMSPNYLGAGYAYPLIYKDGRIELETDANKSKVLKDLTPIDEEELGLMSSFINETDECEEGSSFITYFEAYLMQMKIVGDENRGWKFFDKYYNCSNKENVRTELKKVVDKNYSNLKNWDYTFQKIN